LSTQQPVQQEPEENHQERLVQEYMLWFAVPVSMVQLVWAKETLEPVAAKQMNSLVLEAQKLASELVEKPEEPGVGHTKTLALEEDSEEPAGNFAGPPVLELALRNQRIEVNCSKIRME
jgi:hypothetical protein